MTSSNGAARCRFCDRPLSAGELRAPGPVGPVCVGCLNVGLQVIRDGVTRLSEGGTVLVEVHAVTAPVCEYCGRRERRTFLGGRRTLVRMTCEQSGATICADCLDHGGDLINKASRR